MVFKPEKAIQYFHSVFDDEIGLMLEAPQVKPDWFWVYIDNWLVYHTIRKSAFLTEGEFLKKLRAGLDRHKFKVDHNRVEVLWGKIVSEMWLKPLKTVIKEYEGRKVWTEYCYSYPIEEWTQYADLCFLASINYVNMGKWFQAYWYFWRGRWMWDGTGFNDIITKEVGYYATYKLALYLIASKKVRDFIGVHSQAKEIIGKMQAESGGIYTDYTKDFTTPHPEVDTNTETTAFCLSALT